MSNYRKNKNSVSKYVCPKCGRTVTMKGNYGTDCFNCKTRMIKMW